MHGEIIWTPHVYTIGTPYTCMYTSTPLGPLLSLGPLLCVHHLDSFYVNTIGTQGSLHHCDVPVYFPVNQLPHCRQSVLYPGKEVVV